MKGSFMYIPLFVVFYLQFLLFFHTTTSSSSSSNVHVNAEVIDFDLHSSSREVERERKEDEESSLASINLLQDQLELIKKEKELIRLELEVNQKLLSELQTLHKESGGKTIKTKTEKISPKRKLSGAEDKEILIFEDTFDNFDIDFWSHEITMAGGGNWEFEYYTNNRTNSYVEDGVLYLKPTLTVDTLGEENMLGTPTPYRHDLWGGMTPADQCTSNQFYGCERMADGGDLIINPIQSARVRTHKSLRFKFGRLEVEAKLPKGDWLWPAIWLLPVKNKYGQWPASGEIDIMESRGNKPGYSKGGYDSMGSSMHWGPFFEFNSFELTTKSYTLPTSKGTFNDDFHTFGLYWDSDQLYTYVDDESNKVLEVKFDESFWERGGFEKSGVDNPWVYATDENAAPFDDEFYIIFNVAVGGLAAFFPDGEDNKPWKSTDPNAAVEFWKAKDSWMPTWDLEGDDSAMQIKSVRLWQNPNQGGSVSGDYFTSSTLNAKTDHNNNFQDNSKDTPTVSPTRTSAMNPSSDSNTTDNINKGRNVFVTLITTVLGLAAAAVAIYFIFKPQWRNRYQQISSNNNNVDNGGGSVNVVI